MQEAGLSTAPPDRGGSLWPVVALLAVAIAVLLGESLFGGKVLTQADALYQFQPWAEVAPEGYRPSNEALLDQSIVMLPWMHFSAERFAAGELPLWNPNNYLGQPMVGTYQTAIYWPLNWVYFAWPSWSFHAWSAFARLLAAGVFTLLFLRRLGVGRGSALLGATGFALSGFLIAWLNHMHTHVALFLPALFWSVERTAARPRWREAGLTALLVGGALLAGHIQTAVHVFLAVGAYALYRTRADVGSGPLAARGLVKFVAGAALGVLISMPQVLPFLDYLGASQGAVVLEAVDQVEREGVKQASVLMVAPDHYGSPATGDYRGPHGHNLNYNELIGGYVGRLVLLLALAAPLLVWRRRSSEPRGESMASGSPRWPTAFFVLLALVAALVAWQVWPFYDLARAVPKLRSTKLMRVFVLLAFALACLASIGLEELLRRLRLQGRRAALVTLAAFAVVSLELVGWGRGYNPAVERELVVPPTPVTDVLAERAGLHRVLGIDNSILLPSANLFYDVPLISGYDSVEYKTVTELVARMSSHAGGELFIKEIPYFDRGFPIANLLGARYLLHTEELPGDLGLVLVRDGEVKVYENPHALPRAFAARALELVPDAAERLDLLGADDFDPRVALVEELPSGRSEGPSGQGTVEVVSYAPLRVELAVDLDAPGLVVLTDAWARGWRATANGEPVPVARVDHALRGLWVGAGPTTLVLTYEPDSTRLGHLLGGLGLLAALGLLVFGGRDTR